MQINFSPKVNNVSFKQINLSASEYKDCQNLFKKSLSDSFDLNNRDELFDVFEPHLNREVELKHFKTEKCRRFFAASLYVKFFKMLESCIAYNTGFDSLVDKLNNYCENFVELEQTNNEPSYTNFNVSSVENRAHDLYKYLGMTREDFLKKNQRFPILQSKSVEELKQDVAYVVEKLGFDEEEYIRILTRNFPAIAYSGTSLVEIAQKTMETLEIKELDEFRTLVKINPALLTPHDLAENIADIASFLDVDESRVKEAIKYYSLLATYRIENVKSNFYAMKDYLKVDREKMVDLALLNTAMLTCDLDKNKKRYEDVAGILGILPETFIVPIEQFYYFSLFVAVLGFVGYMLIQKTRFRDCKLSSAFILFGVIFTILAICSLTANLFTVYSIISFGTISALLFTIAGLAFLFYKLYLKELL